MDPHRNFGFLLKDVSRLHTKNFERLSVDLNVNLTQCKVLAYLERHEGLSQAQLAELTDIDPMTLLRTIDRMENDGWVERRADPNDRRVRRLHLTPAATPVLEHMWDRADRARAQAFAGLSPENQEQLLDLLAKIQANLTDALQAAAPPTVSNKDSTHRPTAKRSSSRRKTKSS